MLPLHKDAQNPIREKEGFHAGLWFDRFFDRYDSNWKVPKDEKGKLNWIDSVTKNPLGNKEKLEAFSNRQQRLLASMEGSTLILCSEWHFVTGMGNNHPVENGFAWHPTLGVPYLTGAAVKGMLKAWCKVWSEDKVDLKQWFGDTEQRGELIFFDAIPTEPVSLKADIMTPHYGKWYEEGDKAPKTDGSNLPADWHDPVPVPFLVVDKGQSFQFSVAKTTGSSIVLSEVVESLTEALQWIGAGAKTAAGYGRFSEDEKAKLTREEQQKEAEQARQAENEAQALAQAAEESGLSGFVAELYIHAQQANWNSDKGAFIRDAGHWIEKIEELDDVDQQQEAAKFLARFVELHDKGILANPNKSSGKKNKAVYKPNSIKLAVALNKWIQL